MKSAWDCIGEDNIDVEGDFASLDISTFKKSYLYDWCMPCFQDYEKDPEPIKIQNMSINGDLWNFTINPIETEPSPDYSSYGKWYVTKIEIVDKVKVWYDSDQCNNI